LRGKNSGQPVDTVGTLSHYLQGFIYPSWCSLVIVEADLWLPTLVAARHDEPDATPKNPTHWEGLMVDSTKTGELISGIFIATCFFRGKYFFAELCFDDDKLGWN